MSQKHCRWPKRAACWSPLSIALLACLAVLAAEVTPATSSTTPISIRWTPAPPDSNAITAEVHGLDRSTLATLRHSPPRNSEWQRLFSVRTEQGDPIADIGLPPVAGTYLVETGTIRFTPKFPFEPGVRYRAAFDPRWLPGASNTLARPITAVFQIPIPRAVSTTVVRHVYPSANVLPENLLKFYVHFSASMSRGGIYEHIHVRDHAGKLVELPFLEIDEELWNPDMTRLTLFIDPGRIKRGVKPLEEIGPALEEGHRYTLVIDRAWRDAMGNPLQAAFEKSFKVKAPDREPPDPQRWKVVSPASGARNPLTVVFNESMDHALAQRMIRVVADSGAFIDGTAQLADDERRWSFTPSQAWQAGRHLLAVQTTIEDLAGNNIGKPFEVDLFDGVQRRLTNSTVRIPFTIR